MAIGDTIEFMTVAKIAISLDADDLRELDRLVKRGLFPSRSRVIQDAVAEKLQRLKKVRLARECSKLDPPAEREMAEESFSGDAPWPEY